MMWDFHTLRPESIHQFMFLFGDRGGIFFVENWGFSSLLLNRDPRWVQADERLRIAHFQVGEQKWRLSLLQVSL